MSCVASSVYYLGDMVPVLEEIGICCLFAEEVVGGAHVLVVGAKPQDEPRDYKRLPQSGEALIYVAMSRPMVKRFALS